jgi:two-component system sensor histidine kinase and response regulator WspE
MMRSAHSIKGAAKIVRVAPAAEVAHVMEDCFVAAQKELLLLTSADIDLLLRGVDLITSVAETTKQNAPDWNAFSKDVQEISQSLQAVLRGEVIKAPTTKQLSTERSSTSYPGEITCDAFLDRAHAEATRVALLGAIESGLSPIRLNLSQTTDLDATGLAFLDAASRHLLKRSCPFEFILSPALTQVLTVSGVIVSHAVE